jgi:hypothetical protein
MAGGFCQPEVIKLDDGAGECEVAGCERWSA